MQVATEYRACDRSRSRPSPGRWYATLVLAAWGFPTWSGAVQAKYPKMAPLAQYLYADRATEIALARTAAPKAISDNATVLTLGKEGYETAVKGSNGFVCLIERSWSNDFDHPEFWNPKDNTPQCWNAAASSSWLQDYLTRTKWVLAGVSLPEMVARTKAGLANHTIRLPAPGSMAYMMSKQQYIHDPSPTGGPARWYPHLMFFVPVTDGSPWGANVQGGAVFSATSTAEPVTTYFIVVPRWSDGTLGPYAAISSHSQEHHHHG